MSPTSANLKIARLDIYDVSLTNHSRSNFRLSGADVALHESNNSHVMPGLTFSETNVQCLAVWEHIQLDQPW